MAEIAFLGTGNMGAGMAARLLAAGHAVTVYNRTAEKTAPLTRAGARVAETPRNAAHGAEAVFAMVGDDESAQAVWMGEDGALAATTAANALAIECSTLSHDWVLAFAPQAEGSSASRIAASTTVRMSVPFATAYFHAASNCCASILTVGSPAC